MSKNFSDAELSCKCGCVSPKPDIKLLLLLELIRCRFNTTVTITSGYRCKTHNAKVGGKPNSRHIENDAADIVVKGVDPKEVADFVREHLKAIGQGGLGVSTVFTHVDMRPSAFVEWSY